MVMLHVLKQYETNQLINNRQSRSKLIIGNNSFTHKFGILESKHNYETCITSNINCRL